MRVGVVVVFALLGCSTVEVPETPRQDDPPMTRDPAPTPVAETTLEPTSVTCLARYAFDSNGSILDEQRARAGAAAWRDFAVRYPAAEIGAQHHAVEAVARYQVSGGSILWFTPDYVDAVVDAELFGELQIADATRLQVGDRVELGTVTERGRAGLEPRAVAEFLLHAGVIQTFVHIGSTLCLIGEDPPADQLSYRAEFAGSHEYYTNDENHDPLGFAFEIAADGRLSVTGIAPVAIPSE